MIQYYYTKKEWGVVMEKEELKILEELRRILNSKNEAIVILNNYFKGGVGKSKLSTMFAYLTDKFNLKVLMIDKDLQATLTKDLAKTFKVELPRVNFYEGLKNGNLASSIVHLTDNLDLIPGTFDLMLLPKLTRSWTFENESRLLATLLAPLKSDYDLIIIDTVPTPSVYTNNAIVASDYVIQSKTQGYINEQARPCVFFVSMLRSRHSKRHEHTGENEPTKRKKKGAYTSQTVLRILTR